MTITNTREDDIQHDEGSSIGQRSRDDAINLAAKEGLSCFFPNRNELFIDLDSGELNEKVLERLKENGLEVESLVSTTSKTKGHQHVYLRVNRELDVKSRIALQAALGSDPCKEALSVLRLLEGCDEDATIALFETSQQAIKVQKWAKQ